MEEGPLAGEETGHEDAHRLGQGEDQQEVYSDLEDAIGSHFNFRPLEAFRFEERVNQVTEEKEGEGAG